MCPTTSELTSLRKNSPNPTKPLPWPAGTNAGPGSRDPGCSLLHTAASSLAACPSSTSWGTSCVGPHPGSLLGVPVISSLCCSVLSTEACPGHPVHECTLCLFLPPALSLFLPLTNTWHVYVYSLPPSHWRGSFLGQDVHSIPLRLLRTCPLRVLFTPCEPTDVSPASRGSSRISGPCHHASPPAGSRTRGPCHIQWLTPACHSGFCEGGVWLPRAGAN